jgi:tRNA threonylcarbamoyladenosine biosynthesis protein TsaE
MNETWTTHSPEETQAVAAAFALRLRAGCILALHGTLGAGKTCFVKGLAQALGVRLPVTSPTFTIVNEYCGSVPLYHIDLYRISGPDEALALGLEEYIFGDGITAIEWPDRAGDLLPDDRTIQVALSQPAGMSRARTIAVTAPDTLL